MKSAKTLLATVLWLGAVSHALAEAPVWTYKPDGEPANNWGMVEFADGGQTFQLVHLSFIAAAREGKVGFVSKVPGYTVALPLYTVSPEEDPQPKGSKYLVRCQTALTPYRLHMAIKEEAGKKKITRMTILREDNAAFSSEMDPNKAPSNISAMFPGSDPSKGTYKGKPLWVTVRLPTIASWRNVVFNDGATPMELWFYTASFKRAARGLVADYVSPDPNFQAVLPLVKMTAEGTLPDSSGEKTTWTVFRSEPTSYRLFMKLNAAKTELSKLVVKNGDTLIQEIPLTGSTSMSLQNLGLLISNRAVGTGDLVNGKTALVEIKAGPKGPGLTEYELSMITLMDADARAKALAECKAEPSQAFEGGLLTDCWRGKVKSFLTAQKERLGKASLPPTDFDPFELAYIQKRLGGPDSADYKKFQAQFAKAQKDGKALEFVKAWRERVVKEVNGYLTSSAVAFKPREQLDSIERLLVACDSKETAEGLKFCGNSAWGGGNGGDAVIPGANGPAADQSKIPAGDRRVSLAMKEPPTIGADKGPKEKPKEDKNANVNMLTGVKLGLYTGFLAFLIAGLNPIVFLAAIFGMLLGWAMATDINR